jgi:hypothetical protein
MPSNCSFGRAIKRSRPLSLQDMAFLDTYRINWMLKVSGKLVRTSPRVASYLALQVEQKYLLSPITQWGLSLGMVGGQARGLPSSRSVLTRLCKDSSRRL